VPASRGTPARPVRRGPSPGAIAVAVLRASLRAIVTGLLAVLALVVLAWAADPRSGAGSGEALRAGALAWLVAHGARVAVRGGSFGLAPLTLTLLLLGLALRAGAAVVRDLQPRAPGVAAALGAAVGVPYAVAAALLTGPARTDAARPGPLRALLVAGLLAAVAGAAGGMRARGWDQYARLLPDRVRLVGYAATGALATLAAGGAAVMAAALAWHFSRASSLVDALRPGVVGGLVLTLLCVAYLPNAVVWAVAFAAGTGFAVGTGTSVAPTGVSVGPLPAFPLLAVLPGGGAAPAPALLALVVPLLAGVVAGLFVVRREPGLSAGRAAGWAALSGPVAGLAVAVACVLASGPAGPGRLAETGPGPALTGLAVAEWVALAGAATAAVRARRG
jgi:hypothetical protein